MTAISGSDTKPPATHRNNRYEKRLSLILRAASKVIARDGFDGASVRAVAAEGKVGLSNIYYYFKSKDELLYAIQRRVFSTLVSTLRKRLTSAGSPEEKLKAVIDNHFQFFVNNVGDLKVCVHEIESLSGEYYRNVLKIRREYYRLVRDVVAEVSGASDYEANLSALFLFGSLNWVYMWYDREKNSEIDILSHQLHKVLLNGIKSS
jgi:AcrR family transcriptional regulator